MAKQRRDKEILYGLKLPINDHQSFRVQPLENGEYYLIFGNVVDEDDNNVYQDMVAATKFANLDQLIEFSEQVSAIVQGEKDRLEL